MGQLIDRRIVFGGHALTGWDELVRGERGDGRSVTLDGGVSTLLRFGVEMFDA